MKYPVGIMDIIFSERELTHGKNVPWGQWIFNISNEEIQNKLLQAPKTNQYPSKWNSLYSFLIKKNILKTDQIQNQSKVNKATTCESMDCSIVSDLKEDKSMMDLESDSQLNELVTNVVHFCKQEGTKLNKLHIALGEVVLVRNDLSTISEEQLKFILERTWVQLLSDSSKLRFCELFSSDEHFVRILCESILLPWLSKQAPRNIDQFSEILSVKGDTICRLLIAPLLRVKDSPIVEDLMNLEELMTCMTMKDWSTLLSELVCGLEELERWQIPVFTTIVEHATLSSDYLSSLVHLMSLNGPQYSQNRDFGSLLVAVAKQLTPKSNSLISQLKIICNSYKGSLKFKVLKMLAE